MTTTQAPQRYLKTADLRTLIPVGRTSFYALIKQDSFPQPLQLTPGGDYLWESSEIDEWLATRPRVRFDSPKRRTKTVHHDEDELVLIPVTGRRGAA